MKARFEPSGLRDTKWWEHALRFLFGGAISAIVSLVTSSWGPIAGGLLLAFPSIFPASVTLVNTHDGRTRAIDDARGARLGSLGLMAFAAVVWFASPLWKPAAVLVTATVAWLVVDLAAWAIVYGPRRE